MPEIPPGVRPMTSPGCQKEMEQSALMGIWIRPDGAMQPHQTCPRCSRVLTAKGKAADRLSTKIEEVLMAAIEAKQEVVH